MSLYNMLFGQNPNTEIILAIIGLKESDIERFRDCGFDDEGIYIYTRTGGGNRKSYSNEKLTSNKYYILDEDDNFDCTYATYYFKIPDEIKLDVEKFKDYKNEGITGDFIQWVLKTLDRKPTKDDIHHSLWNEQNYLINAAKKLSIFETNGHTVVPLDDNSTRILLELMEKNNGEQLSYSVMPYKIIVKENVSKWETLDKNKNDIEKDMCRVKIKMENNWTIDYDLWDRWQKKFKEKFPKSIATIKDYIDYE